MLIVSLNLIFFANISSSRTQSQNNEIISDDLEKDLKSSDLVLTDKVYTFLAPSDRLTFKNYFEEDYMYYISIELVTPHDCSPMRITILDPDDKQFNIFESDMFYNPEYGRYFEIPFGAVESGLYNITFYSVSTLNFNMHILIEQGPKCLYDKIGQHDPEDLIHYKVKTFDDSKYNIHDVDLKTDEMYKFYLGRVSAITIIDSNEVRVDYSIEDEDGNEFYIYTNKLLADIDSINSFSFGTASSGTYTIKLTVYIADPDVEYVNLAYAIVDDYTIGDAVDVNNTESDVEKSNSEDPDMFDELIDNSLILPIEWTIGTLLFVGGLAGVIVVMLVQHRKDNVVSLSMRNK